MLPMGMQNFTHSPKSRLSWFIPYSMGFLLYTNKLQVPQFEERQRTDLQEGLWKS